MCSHFGLTYFLTACYFGLGHSQYMPISVQRGGQFRYVTTSVHTRSISVHVSFGTRLRYIITTISVTIYILGYVGTGVGEPT